LANPIPLSRLPAEAAQSARKFRTPATFQSALKSCARLMLSDVKNNFNESHDPDGQPWAPLAHPRPSGGAKPLQDTGLLRASFSSRVGATTAIVGSNKVGVNLHQMGGTIVPRRAVYLAIPLTRAAQRAGSPRRFPGLLHAVIGLRGGVMLDEKGEAQYALTKGPIRIPARPMVGFGARLLMRLDALWAGFLARVAGGE
jgi:phage gpG-like protein